MRPHQKGEHGNLCVPPIRLFDEKYKGFCAANLFSLCLPVETMAEARLVSSYLSITWGPKFGGWHAKGIGESRGGTTANSAARLD